MDKAEYARRRRVLAEAMDERSIVIIPSAPVRQRNRDIEFPYRPDSDFYYLTGFPEPDAVAVLLPGRRQGEYLLFCRERNADAERWDGMRAGLEGACELYGADDAFPSSDLDDILPGLMEDRDRVFYAMGYYPEFDRRVLGWVNRIRARFHSGDRTPAEFVALDHLLHDARLYKSSRELRLMRHAAQISARAHRRAMAACRPGLMEYQLEAELMHEFIGAGSRAAAYPSIVAGGANACILHYTRNGALLKDGDLVLVDAGAEYGCYAADVARTFPVNGRFSPAQRTVYEIVLEAQRVAIDKVRAGNHWGDPHAAAVRVLTEGLVDLGLLKGKVVSLVKRERYKKYCMHRTGHWIGLDVHDVGDYTVGGAWRVLEPGMTLTVEPGLYIRGGEKRIARRWWNIGVRIEDDVLVTGGEPEVLSAGAPKTVAEVEALVGSGAR